MTDTVHDHTQFELIRSGLSKKAQLSGLHLIFNAAVSLEKAKSIKSGVQDKAQRRSWPCKVRASKKDPTLKAFSSKCMDNLINTDHYTASEVSRPSRRAPRSLSTKQTCDQFLSNVDDCGQPQVLKVISVVLHSEGQEHTHVHTNWANIDED